MGGETREDFKQATNKGRRSSCRPAQYGDPLGSEVGPISPHQHEGTLIMMLHPSITSERIMALITTDRNIGVCAACGEEQGGVVPDACHYTCDACGEQEVFGAEDLLFHLEA